MCNVTIPDFAGFFGYYGCVNRMDGLGWVQSDTEYMRIPGCGDGFLDTSKDEQCDDMNSINHDGCNATCKIEIYNASWCGDGILFSPDESCEDGNTNDNDYCTNDCAFNVFGDGHVNYGTEQCDDGSQNGVPCVPVYGAPCYYCSSTGVRIRLNYPYWCGDGIVNITLGEQCDDRNYENEDGCDSSCRFETYNTFLCGNGNLDLGEGCDDGNSINHDGCSSTCQNEIYDSSWCGDGILFRPNEQCDDNNIRMHDGCYNCQLETYSPLYCGDGIKFRGYESCDDGNTQSYDSCSNTCLIEKYSSKPYPLAGLNYGIPDPSGIEDVYNVRWYKCGDGTVDYFYGETCDDGNTLSGDSCSSLCKNETYLVDGYCGDGILFSANESCDDGCMNGIPHICEQIIDDGDSCNSTCNR
jgi:cysteine-rich repeat protein